MRAETYSAEVAVVNDHSFAAGTGVGFGKGEALSFDDAARRMPGVSQVHVEMVPSADRLAFLIRTR